MAHLLRSISALALALGVVVPSARAQDASATAGRREAPTVWHRLDLAQDSVPGTGVDRALRELLAGRTPARRVTVAVIDGGVDTAHAQLSPALWRNAREVAGNRRDDDRNGYVDDVRGWSFIPALPGDSGVFDTFELTRLHSACRSLPAGAGLPRPEAAQCGLLADKYAEKRAEVSQIVQQIGGLTGMVQRVTALLRQGIPDGPLTDSTVRALTPSGSAQAEAQRMWLQFAANGLDSASLAEARTVYEGQLRFGLDTMFDGRPRGVVGTPDVMGGDAKHGTHVAGIIGAIAGGGAHGIAAGGVTLLPIRAVPNGDERDEEIARAIRYAVDAGALVINMSFGKGWSPRKAAVDSAVRYATAKGVLLVHAAGNDAQDNDTTPSFPTRRYLGGGESALWLEIGASSWKGLDQLAAPFSNYGRTTVDFFAPGVDIVSTIPGGGTAPESGTSMAAPVVSGVAALLLSHFPTLTPTQVRTILLETVRPLPDLAVGLPGDPSVTVPFGQLSKTGGLLDAYAAVRRALELTGAAR